MIANQLGIMQADNPSATLQDALAALNVTYAGFPAQDVHFDLGSSLSFIGYDNFGSYDFDSIGFGFTSSSPSIDHSSKDDPGYNGGKSYSGYGGQNSPSEMSGKGPGMGAGSSGSSVGGSSQAGSYGSSYGSSGSSHNFSHEGGAGSSHQGYHNGYGGGGYSGGGKGGGSSGGSYGGGKDHSGKDDPGYGGGYSSGGGGKGGGYSSGGSSSGGGGYSSGGGYTSGGNGYSDHGTGPGGGYSSGGGNPSHSGKDDPVILDLDGNGVSVTPLGSSVTFVETDGDGLKHRTAWAGPGDGVLVLDLNDDGVITDKKEYVFTTWDGTAKSDFEALKTVFDTNHNGLIDAGDDRFAEFKVMVNGQMVSLASLGIASIGLTAIGSGQVFADGSAITGMASYTKTDGTTGLVGDASLATETSQYKIETTAAAGANGATVTTLLGYAADGTKAFQNIVTVNAGGTSTEIKFDDNGDGVIDRKQTIDLASAAGALIETVANFNADGSLANKTTTTTSADLKSITTLVDQDGNGVFDQSQTFVVDANGASQTIVKELSHNGAVLSQVVTTASADGLSKIVKTDPTGGGVFDRTVTETTVINADLSRTKTVAETSANGALIAKTVTATSADGLAQTIELDRDGNGLFDQTIESIKSIDAAGAISTAAETFSASGALLSKSLSKLSADGLSQITQTDLNGDGVYDRTHSNITVIGADLSQVETLATKSGDGTLLEEIVTTTSGDKKTNSVQSDFNGDGAVDQIESIAVSANGSTAAIVSSFNPDGSLKTKTIIETAAGGLSSTTKIDMDGNGVIDKTEVSVILANPDGSQTKTVTAVSANGALFGKSVTTTSADSLTQTVKTDITGDGVFDQTVTDKIVLNSDGSRTETVTSLNANGSLASKITTTDSADRLTTTVQTDANGDTKIDETQVVTLNADGSSTTSVTSLNANGTLKGKSVLSVSASGLTTLLQADVTGDGVFDSSTSDVTTLNADGSQTQTLSTLSGNGTLVSKSVLTVSGNGLSKTVETDINGDGVFDGQALDVTALNADGSTTQTLTSLAANGAVIGKTVTTVSANGLSSLFQSDADGNGAFEKSVTDVTILGADGSTVETLTVMNESSGIIGKTVTTTSAYQKLQTIAADSDGDNDLDAKTIIALNGDGSTVTTAETYGVNGSLASKSIVTVSASGLSSTTQTDLNGDGIIDQSMTDNILLNADGSTTETISHLKADGSLKDKTVVTVSANGLSTTTKWDATGAGSFNRSKTETLAIGADGGTTETVSFFKANGALENKTTTTVSANKMTVSTAQDGNGDGFSEKTSSTVTGADGSMTSTLADYVVTSMMYKNGVPFMTTALADKTTIVVSANGLSKTIQHDVDGNGSIDSKTTDVITLNADGSKTQTISNFVPGAFLFQPMVLKNKTLITTSADGLTKTTQWDLAGTGVYGKSQTDVTVLNADGSKTETISNFVSGALKTQYEISISANNLCKSTKWDIDGVAGYDLLATDIVTFNADGSSTQTITNTQGNGSLLSKVVTIISADGQTKTAQEDINGDGAFDQGETDTLAMLADGSTIATFTHIDANGNIKDKTVASTSGDGQTISISRDADGNSTTDQTEVTTFAVDGSKSTVITDFGVNGQKQGETIVSTAPNGTVTTTWDLNADGAIDRVRTVTSWKNANGSMGETVTDANYYALLSKKTTTVSADGKTITTNWDANGDNIVDQTKTTVFDASGVSVTTTTNGATFLPIPQQLAPRPGDVVWTMAVPKKTITTTSADGLSKTVQADYDGNGVFEVTETSQVQIDGSIVTAIKQVDGYGNVIAQGVLTVSADGMTTTLKKDSQNTGAYDHIDSCITHVDGSKTQTVIDLNTDGTLKQQVVTEVSANGESKSVWTTSSTASSAILTGTALELAMTDGNDVLTVTGNKNALALGEGADKATVTGNNNTLAFGGGNDIVTVKGNSNALTFGAGSHTITISGSNDDLQVSSSNITLQAGASAIITGTNNIITLYAKATVTVMGSGNTIQYAGGKLAFVTGNEAVIVDESGMSEVQFGADAISSDMSESFDDSEGAQIFPEGDMIALQTDQLINAMASFEPAESDVLAFSSYNQVSSVSLAASLQ